MSDSLQPQEWQQARPPCSSPTLGAYPTHVYGVGDAAAAAKSLQSCPTLYGPIDGSPPGSPIPGILQARTLEWVAISFSSAWKWKVKVKSLSRVWLLATPWTAAYQAPPSMGFSRQEYWSGMLSWWCHPTILSSVVPFSSCLQSFPASGPFQMSQLFPLVGQSIGVSSSASVLPMNTQDWSPLGWTGWISLQFKGLSRVFSNTTVQKHQFFSAQISLQPTLPSKHDHWKNHSLD